MNFILFVITLITLYNGISSLANWDPTKRSESRLNNIRAIRQAGDDVGGIEDPSNGEVPDNGWKRAAIAGTTSAPTTERTVDTHPVLGNGKSNNGRLKRNTGGSSRIVYIVPDDGSLANSRGIPSDGWDSSAINRILELNNSTSTTSSSVTTPTSGRSTQPFTGNRQNGNNRIARQTDVGTGEVPDKQSSPGIAPDTVLLIPASTNDTFSTTTSTQVTTAQSRDSSQQQNRNVRQAKESGNQNGVQTELPATDRISGPEKIDKSTPDHSVHSSQPNDTELPAITRNNGPEPIDKSTATSSLLPSSKATIGGQSDNHLTKNNRVARQSGSGNGKTLNDNDEELQVNGTVANNLTTGTASPHSNVQKNQNIRIPRETEKRTANSPPSQGGNSSEHDDSREDSHEDNSTSTTSHSGQTSRSNRYIREARHNGATDGNSSPSRDGNSSEHDNSKEDSHEDNSTSTTSNSGQTSRSNRYVRGARHNGATDRQSLPEHGVFLKDNETTTSEPKTYSPSAPSVDASSSIPVTSTSFESSNTFGV